MNYVRSRRLCWLLLFPCALFSASPEEILASLSLEEKVGQLFVAPACPLHNESHFFDLKKLIDECHIGGVLVKQADAFGPGRLLNRLQATSSHPLLVLSDAEWGLSMTMQGTPIFPKNMTLGAIQDMGLIERMGREIGREALSIGIHMNLAPVVDVNSNPENPIIHMRSFGDDPYEVAKRGVAITKGMKQAGLSTCMKHFPGHGDTKTDSHLQLPVIDSSLKSLYANELIPFMAGIDSDAIMLGHILFPALDQVPATLSFPITTSLLRTDLGFAGLVITDALNMKALTSHYSTEEIALKAHKAGADLLLYGNHLFEEVDDLIRVQIPLAYRTLLNAYQNSSIPIEHLDRAVLRILKVKNGYSNRSADELPYLFTEEAIALKEDLYQAAITQIGPDFAPIDPNTAYFCLPNLQDDILHSAFCPCKCYSWDQRGSLLNYSRVVVSLRGLDHRKENCGLSSDALAFFRELSSKAEVVYCVFGTPYVVKLLPKQSTILVGYEEDAQRAVLNVLSGENKAIGHLPIHY